MCGDVPPDQLPMSWRVGVDRVVLPGGADLAVALSNYESIADTVQPVANGEPSFSARWPRAA